jgi:cobalt-zinc-cadmium efflux system membrane fusion protein
MYIRIACSTLLLAVIFSSCHQGPKDEAPEAFVLSDTMMATTTLDQATMQPVESELRLYGKIAADNNRQAQVFSVLPGTVIKLNAELGDYVQKGQVLAIVRSGDIAEMDRQRLEAGNNVAIAEKNLQVAKDLYAGKLNSSKDVVVAEKEYESSKASLQRSNELTRIYHSGPGATYEITAPLSGFIIDKNITENMQLTSDRTENLFSIAQIDEVWVLVNVPETEISRIKIGMEAKVTTLSYPDKVFTAHVDKIFNVLDNETKAMKVRIRIVNPDNMLKPEMSATISLLQKEDRSMIAIPAKSVIFDKSKNWVMLYHDRKHIETRPIELYHTFGDRAYISSGLKVGDTVISKNQLLIYDALND